MEEKSISPWKSSLTYGLYLGIAIILISVIFYVTGNPFAKSAQWISYGVMIAGVIIAQFSYRKLLGEVMTYSQALAIGVLTMLFASVITGFFTYLLYAIIDPSLQEQLRLSIEEQLVKQGRVPEEQIDMAVEMAAKFQKPAIMFVMSILSGTFVGLIISLITSIFTQKKPKEDFSA
ncbi:DUF4199 domain-containing protein [Mariniphaga sediminis]|jgi:predicted membrane protein|uniref:DUF4199 domain-containing protein n=1 Tax=Mariniphaga sediminis TaxID=1628158 RepID=A0A399CUH3_9BACT|nr:DUF4199 domain-containing protein [Mariniphaga sediminis]RIH63137.1 DUF4199 domain-containing protein [Mariniphaga sediminis]